MFLRVQDGGDINSILAEKEKGNIEQSKTTQQVGPYQRVKIFYNYLVNANNIPEFYSVLNKLYLRFSSFHYNFFCLLRQGLTVYPEWQCWYYKYTVPNPASLTMFIPIYFG